MNIKQSALIGFLAILFLLGGFWISNSDSTQKQDYSTEQVDYSDISHLRNINGSLGYLAVKEGNVEDATSPFNNEQVKAVIDGREVDMSKKNMARTFDISFPSGPSPKQSKPFLVENGNESTIVSESGNITPRYTPVVEVHLLNVNNSIAYSTAQNESMFYVVNGTPQEKFRNIFQPTVVNGKLAYGAADKENNTFILFDREKIGEEYDLVTRTAEVDGKLAYVAYRNNTGFVVYDGEKYGRFLGEELGEKYFRITHVEGIKGKPFFTGENKTHFFYYHGNKSIGPFKTAALNPVVIDSQIIFDSKINGKESIVRWDIAG